MKIVKRILISLVALMMAFGVFNINSVFAEEETTPEAITENVTSSKNEDATFKVTVDLTVAEGFSVTAVTFNGEEKTETPYEFTVTEAKEYDYSIAYVNDADTSTALTKEGKYTVTEETSEVTPSEAPESTVDWVLPGEAERQWSTTDENMEIDLVAALEISATDKVTGEKVEVTLKDNGGLDTSVAGVYTLVFAVYEGTDAEETTSVDLYIKGEELIADPMAGTSTIDIAWSSGTYNNPGNGTQTGGTDKSFTIISPDSGNDQLQATIALNIKEHYGVGEFSFKIPGGLDLYRAEFAPEKAPIDKTDLPLPLKPATNAGGWQYEVDENGDIVVTNTVELNPTSQQTSFSLKYNVNPMKVKPTVTSTLAPTMVKGTATVNGASVTYDAISKITSMSKGHTTVYTFPAGQVSYFGEVASSFDFANKTYIDYTINVYVAGTLGGSLSVKEIPTLSANDKVIGMTTTVYDPADPNGIYNAANKTYTFNPDVASTPGWKTVHVLIEYDKATHQDPAHPGDILIPDNKAEANHVSSDGTNTPVDEHHKEATDPGFKFVPLTGAYGQGTLMDKTPNVLPSASAAGALTKNGKSDSYIGQYSISGNIFENAEGSKMGFIVGDDAVYYHKVDDPSSIGKLVDNQYYYSEIYVKIPDYTFTGTSKNGKVIEIADATTESVMIKYKTSLGGGWINGPTFTYAEVFNGVSWNSAYAASPMPANVVAFEVVGTGYDYRAEISVKPTLYIKKGVGSIITNSDLSNSVVFENFSYMAPTSVDGTTILKFKKYNDVEIAQDDTGYKTFAESAFSSKIDTMVGAEGGGTTTAVVDAINVSTTNVAYIHQSGFFMASGLQGESGVNFVENSHANDVDNMIGHQQRTITGYERYVMSKQNIAAFLADNEHLERTSGTLYDLLPLGVEYVGNPVATGVGGTTATAACTAVDNFNGTGRTLVACSISNVTGGTGGNVYYPDCGFGTSALYGAGEYLQTGFSVKYDTKVKWDNNQASTTTKDLLVYQIEAGASLIGNYPGISDMTADDSSAIVRLDPDTQAVVAGSQAVQDAFTIVTADGNYPLSNLGSTTTSLNTVYNTGLPYPLFSTLNKTGLIKDVSLSEGSLDYKDSATVEVGNAYQYRLIYANGDSGTVKNIVLYDVLEDAKGTHPDFWKGTFESVDIQTLTGAGINPVVYYSTAVGVFDVDDPAFAYNLTDSAQAWSTTMPVDKTKITAIAIDCTTSTAGTVVQLNQNQQIEATIHMKAPATIDKVDAMANTVSGKQNGYAYNRAAASVYHETGPYAGTQTLVIDINYATQVKLVDSRLAIDLTKNDDLPTHGPVAGAYFTLKGNTDTNLLTTQLALDIEVKSAAADDVYMDPTTGTLKPCTEGKLYEVVTTNDGGTPDDRTDDTEELYELKLYPSDADGYTLTEIIAPDQYIMDPSVKDNTYTIMVTETEDTNVTPSTWSYEYSVTYTYIDPETQQESEKYTYDPEGGEDDGGMINNIFGRRIGGNVWVDNNHDGEPQPTDPTYPERLWQNATVSLVDATTGLAVNDVAGAPVGDATTDANGDYLFEKLPLGTYRVILNVDTTKYVATNIPTPETATSNDCSMSLTRAVTQYIVIDAIDVTEENQLEENFGVVPNITIKKYVRYNNVDYPATPIGNAVDIPGGKEFSYMIKVNNPAIDPQDIVPNVTVKDTLFRTFEIFSVTPTGTITGQTVEWTNQVIEPGNKLYTINTKTPWAPDKEIIYENVALLKQENDPDWTESNIAYVKVLQNKKPDIPNQYTVPNTGVKDNTLWYVIATIGCLSLAGYLFIKMKNNSKKA